MDLTPQQSQRLFGDHGCYVAPQISHYGAISRKGSSFTRHAFRLSFWNAGNAILLNALKWVSPQTIDYKTQVVELEE